VAEWDAFFSKLNPVGNSKVDMLYSTYLGGSGSDSGYGIAVDSSGNVYISGSAGSSGFPTTTNAYSTIYGGGSSDAIAAKFSGLPGATTPILTAIISLPQQQPLCPVIHSSSPPPQKMKTEKK